MTSVSFSGLLRFFSFCLKIMLKKIYHFQVLSNDLWQELMVMERAEVMLRGRHKRQQSFPQCRLFLSSSSGSPSFCHSSIHISRLSSPKRFFFYFPLLPSAKRSSYYDNRTEQVALPLPPTGADPVRPVRKAHPGNPAQTAMMESRVNPE